MMEVDVNCGVFKHTHLTMKRDRERDMSCVAEDLSMSSKKRSKRPSMNIITVETKTENSRLPEGTFLKTDVITQIMDIQQPLSSLRTLLENRLGVDLSSFQFWLQDKLKMLPQKSLGDQCIQTEGLAQIKVELKQLAGNNRINIIDVLKYTEDPTDDEEDCSVEDLSLKNVEESTDSSNESSPSRWSIYEDINSLFPIPLPSDPESWTEVQIHHWLQWAMQEFKVNRVCESMWNITGKQLCQMDKREFQQKVPVDNNDLLWTHIELLRKCRIFAVVDKNGHRQQSQTSSKQVKQSQNVRKPRTPSASSTTSIGNGRRPCMTGHNGQIQLWQFLLELLGDKSRKNVIQWVGRNGEFKLNDPELVAQMWGERKNKPKMNYEKLSRALRYYYSESMIAKVHGRRFVYKFVCNLKELVGYTSEELITMVEDDLSTLKD